MDVIIDYLSVTVPGSVCGGDPELALVSFGDWLTSPASGGLVLETGGGRGYEHRARIAGGYGWAYWGGDNMRDTVHLEFSGAALRWFSDVAGASALDVLQVVCEAGLRVTRVDIAIDDRPGASECPVLRFGAIYEALCSGSVTMRAQTFQPVYSERRPGDAFDPEIHGWTLYLGSRRSGQCVRIYNKAAEQHVEGHWVRVELELKGDKARQFVDGWRLAGFGGRYAAGVIRSFVQFRECNPSDVNKSRWPVARWWLRFLEAASRVVLSRAESTFRSVKRAMDWVESQVLPTLAMIDVAYFRDDGFWRRWLDAGRVRMTQQHKAAVEGDWMWKRISGGLAAV